MKGLMNISISTLRKRPPVKSNHLQIYAGSLLECVASFFGIASSLLTETDRRMVQVFSYWYSHWHTYLVFGSHRVNGRHVPVFEFYR